MSIPFSCPLTLTVRSCRPLPRGEEDDCERERDREHIRTRGVKREFLVDVRVKGKSLAHHRNFTSPIIGLIFVLHR